MLCLTVLNAFGKYINTQNAYLFSLKEAYIIFTSSIRACLVEWPFINPNCYQTANYF